ncbi:MAG: hypothetical protein A3J62_01020 [Candidatus Buchananbacteria bacterium RIFCSPHIGHO2_02_FULL_38_8]|uniref:Uncharacterized protein n=1 Tax=Candidatus Buchananbacteria bacterium RIFCSPHIGHO2_02_FULL_38_8 TaxID=1797538 RepID=A0A1G1Y608_9BACT|nr:MAG: hypothetical protein A3J62_01020 [Candidatus Buchananbacteria bacterium RIFCSPHIGHO2_02_FULL_38_8]
MYGYSPVTDEKRKKGTKNVMGRRKVLRKRAKRWFPGRPMMWLGGILYFNNGHSLERVPNIEEVPKFGQQTNPSLATEWNHRRQPPIKVYSVRWQDWNSQPSRPKWPWL